LLKVKKAINIFLAHFRFLKKLQNLLMLLGIIRSSSPNKISIDVLLPAAKFGLKLAQLASQNLFQSVFIAGGRRMHRFNLPFSAPAIPTYPSSLKCNFCILNRLVIVVL